MNTLNRVPSLGAVAVIQVNFGARKYCPETLQVKKFVRPGSVEPRDGFEGRFRLIVSELRYMRVPEQRKTNLRVEVATLARIAKQCWHACTMLRQPSHP